MVLLRDSDGRASLEYAQNKDTHGVIVVCCKKKVKFSSRLVFCLFRVVCVSGLKSLNRINSASAPSSLAERLWLGKDLCTQR
jgi:hypothetical protein